MANGLLFDKEAEDMPAAAMAQMMEGSAGLQSMAAAAFSGDLEHLRAAGARHTARFESSKVEPAQDKSAGSTWTRTSSTHGSSLRM